MIQKFHKGDLVYIADDLGSSMSHFASGRNAIVIGSYADQFGDGRDRQSYTLYLKDSGEHSWYYESQLTLIESNRQDILDAWKSEAARDIELKSDLEWIFSHPEIMSSEKIPGCSIQALADCLRFGSLWGSRGEGFVWDTNARIVLSLADPFIRNRDKAGWIEFCSDKTKNAASGT